MKKEKKTRVLLEILNLAEGNIDLLEMAKLKNFKLIDHLSLIQDLIRSKYIKKNENFSNYW